MTMKLDPAITAWIIDPHTAAKPPRAVLAPVVKESVRALEKLAPGHTVEVRVPPFVAVQCIDGPRHTRGTPPNVVEADAWTWLNIACGRLDLEAAEVSGARAREVSEHLPLFRL